MEIRKISKKLISLDPTNPRQEYEDGELEQLRLSIEAVGQQEPVHLEELSKDTYMVNEGNKRVTAIKKSKSVDFVLAIVEKTLPAPERLLRQIIMDTHRKNWSMGDRDKAWKKLWDMGKYTNETFAKKLSVSTAMAESFMDRVSLGNAFVGTLKSISAYNITETKNIKDKALRKKIIKFADKKGLGRGDIRKLSRSAGKVSSKVIDSLVKSKIVVDDLSNMVGMSEKDQDTALETTAILNKHKKGLKRMITSGQIKTEDKKLIMQASAKIDEFQNRFFKLSSDLRMMSLDLEELNDNADLKKVINTQLGSILRSCLEELEDKVVPAINGIKKTLGKY